MKIPVSHGHLEMALRNPDTEPSAGGVVCHPHPVHGGTMHTKAVYRASRALNEVGMRTLRFNFRGVGYSTGSFDDGIGEEEDVRAALDWLALGLPERPLVVGGLSFGSMVGLKAGMTDPRVVAMFGLGLPVRVYDYSFLSSTRKPVLIVQGEHDEYGSAQEVSETMAGLGVHITMEAVLESGHLFQDHLGQLGEILREFFRTGPGGAALKDAAQSVGGARR